MIDSRKIEVCKCQYAHFAHIRLSFGCTDEKMDFGTYLDTNCRIPQILKFAKLKFWNIHRHIFRISKRPDLEQSRIYREINYLLENLMCGVFPMGPVWWG